MGRIAAIVGAVGWMMAATTSTARAQSAARSVSSGFFLGLGLEGTGVTTERVSGGNLSESGSGLGLVLGYGFNPRWSLLIVGSSAIINQEGGGDYGLGHFDIGARVHFRTGPNVVVPFLQFGLSGRAEGQTVTDGAGGTHDISSGGAGIMLGGGMNAHFNRKLAFSASLVASGGKFDTFKIDGQSQTFPSVSVSTSRLHLGVVWFPKG